MLSDDAVRTELERIDPDCSYTWDIHTKDLKCDGCPVEKSLYLLAETSLRDRESLQALGEIAEKAKKAYDVFDAHVPSKCFTEKEMQAAIVLGHLHMIQQIACNAVKGRE